MVKAYSSCVGEGPFTCEWFGNKMRLFSAWAWRKNAPVSRMKGRIFSP